MHSAMSSLWSDLLTRLIATGMYSAWQLQQIETCLTACSHEINSVAQSADAMDGELRSIKCLALTYKSAVQPPLGSPISEYMHCVFHKLLTEFIDVAHQMKQLSVFDNDAVKQTAKGSDDINNRAAHLKHHTMSLSHTLLALKLKTFAYKRLSYTLVLIDTPISSEVMYTLNQCIVQAEYCQQLLESAMSVSRTSSQARSRTHSKLMHLNMLQLASLVNILLPTTFVVSLFGMNTAIPFQSGGPFHTTATDPEGMLYPTLGDCIPFIVITCLCIVFGLLIYQYTKRKDQCKY